MSSTTVVTYVHCSPENRRIVLLEKCIQSIQRQMGKGLSIEHIITDDGSTVDIKPMIKKYKNIRYFRQDHGGILKSTRAFNNGFQEAKNDHLIICSSDDVQLPGALKVLSTYLDNHRKCVAVVGSVKSQTYSGGKLITDIKKIKTGKVDKSKLLVGNFINGCAIMFRKTALDQIELPVDKAGMAADYDMWIKLSEVGPIQMIPQIVVKYRDFGNAMRCYKDKKKDSKKAALRKESLKYIKHQARIRRGLI